MAVKGLRAWVEKLGKIEMPVLASVVKELNELTGSDEADVNQLAEVILKDANLTSQVLRIANSVQYNPSSYPITTVSRAIVLIGFTGVRAICISVMVIDSLLGKQPRERLLETMAKAFHAAVQARNLVRQVNDTAKEEVFISALLYHVGEMAFWACGDDTADELEALLQDDTGCPKEGVEKVTGTSMKAITKALAGVWSLGETLEEALYPPSSPTPKVTAVCLGEEISRTAEKGWDSSEMNETLSKVVKFTGLSYLQVRQMVMEAADEAAGVALTYGAAKVCHLIPTSQVHVGDEPAERSRVMKADAQLQLNILRELSNALSEKLDVNTIFKMVLEGLHRGVGLERVCVAFIQKDQMQAKYVLGEGTEKWREKFSYSVSPQQDNIFTYTIKQGKSVWLDPAKNEALKHLYSNEILGIIGKYSAFAAGITLNNRYVALFYADRWNLGGTLQQEQYESFRHFVMQTQLSLQMLSQRKKNK